MSEQTGLSNSMYCFLPMDVEGFGPLAELALDMRWSWNHYADDVWRRLDPALWELTKNPWVVLQTVSRDKLQHMFADPAFRKEVDALVQTRRRAAEKPAASDLGVPVVAVGVLYQRGYFRQVIDKDGAISSCGYNHRTYRRPVEA